MKTRKGSMAAILTSYAGEVLERTMSFKNHGLYKGTVDLCVAGKCKELYSFIPLLSDITSSSWIDTTSSFE